MRELPEDISEHEDDLFSRLRDYPPRVKKLERKVRRCRRVLKSTRFLQASRTFLDLTHFGKGRAERLCSAVILSLPFFFLTFWLCQGELSAARAIAVSGLVVLFVVIIAAMLVLGKTDAELEVDSQELKKELSKLQDRIADLEKQWDADERREKAQRAAEEEAFAARLAAWEARRPKLQECPDCSASVSNQAASCPKCGCPFQDEKERGSFPVLLVVFGAIILFASLGGLVCYFQMDTTVGNLFVGRVHNIGLLSERQNGIILTAIGAAVGLAVLLFGVFLLWRK
jgi:hypothetical protein